MREFIEVVKGVVFTLSSIMAGVFIFGFVFAFPVWLLMKIFT